MRATSWDENAYCDEDGERAVCMAPNDKGLDVCTDMFVIEVDDRMVTLRSE